MRGRRGRVCRLWGSRLETRSWKHLDDHCKNRRIKAQPLPGRRPACCRDVCRRNPERRAHRSSAVPAAARFPRLRPRVTLWFPCSRLLQAAPGCSRQLQAAASLATLLREWDSGLIPGTLQIKTSTRGRSKGAELLFLFFYTFLSTLRTSGPGGLASAGCSSSVLMSRRLLPSERDVLSWTETTSAPPGRPPTFMLDSLPSPPRAPPGLLSRHRPRGDPPQGLMGGFHRTGNHGDAGVASEPAPDP